MHLETCSLLSAGPHALKNFLIALAPSYVVPTCPPSHVVALITPGAITHFLCHDKNKTLSGAGCASRGQGVQPCTTSMYRMQNPEGRFA